MAQDENRVFDFSRLEEVTGGDQEFEQELLEEFLSDTQAVFARLSEAVSGEDHKTLQMESHALKGSSLSLGAGQLGHIAAEMETLGGGGRAGEACSLLSDIEAEFERVRAVIRERLQRAA